MPETFIDNPGLIGPPEFPPTGMVPPQHWRHIPGDATRKGVYSVDTGWDTRTIKNYDAD